MLLKDIYLSQDSGKRENLSQSSPQKSTLHFVLQWLHETSGYRTGKQSILDKRTTVRCRYPSRKCMASLQLQCVNLD